MLDMDCCGSGLRRTEARMLATSRAGSQHKQTPAAVKKASESFDIVRVDELRKNCFAGYRLLLQEGT